MLDDETDKPTLKMLMKNLHPLQVSDRTSLSVVYDVSLIAGVLCCGQEEECESLVCTLASVYDIILSSTVD